MHSRDQDGGNSAGLAGASMAYVVAQESFPCPAGLRELTLLLVIQEKYSHRRKQEEHTARGSMPAQTARDEESSFDFTNSFSVAAETRDVKDAPLITIQQHRAVK
jgi:hypothetical protein